MKKSLDFLMYIAIAFFACLCFSVYADGVVSDTLGIAGQYVGKLFGKINLPAEGIAFLVSFLAMVIYRVIQIGLQSLPTRWKWVNNRITLGLINRILSWIFGKTTMCYNAKLEENAVSDEKAKAELKTVLIKHLTRKGGELNEINKAFNEAVKK